MLGCFWGYIEKIRKKEGYQFEKTAKNNVIRRREIKMMQSLDLYFPGKEELPYGGLCSNNVRKCFLKRNLLPQNVFI